jgi:hypothetical protein
MSFEFEITTDRTNKYLRERDREYYLGLAEGWKDSAPAPAIVDINGATLWDDSVTGVGTKGRWGDLFMQRVTTKEVAYVQPRVGWAGVSLSALAKKYDKDLTLFMPAAKRISDHQLVCVERGARPLFRRIAAMPVLNKYARDYAAEVGATFVPFGLDHELVVAAGVASTLQQWADRPEPKDVVSVVSTGVLSRTLQIAFPNARFHGVAVARNLKAGEIGRASVVSYHRPFLQNADFADEIRAETGINSAPNYDMKGLEYLLDSRLDGVKLVESTLFWNVAGDIKPSFMKHEEVDSAREWGEVR